MTPETPAVAGWHVNASSVDPGGRLTFGGPLVPRDDRHCQGDEPRDCRHLSGTRK
jgi:hypothetical protein